MAPIKVTNLNLLYSELNNFKSKEEKLFGKKCFLEIILGLIKNSQNDIITNEINKDKNIFFVKNILKSLMKDLLEIKREKEKEFILNTDKVIFVGEYKNKKRSGKGKEYDN